jgi:hypothetical protein
MAMAIPSAATLQERVPMASDAYGMHANCLEGASVYVSHGIGSIAPHATLAYDAAGKLVERDHASRFDAYLSALQHVAGML